MGEDRACRYEPEAARELEQRENLGGGGGGGGGDICASPRGKADRVAELTATRAAATAVSTPSMGLSNPK